MTQYNLVEESHPLLNQRLEEFDFSNPPVDPVELAQGLTEAMLRHKGIGLSANQVGLPYRVFVMATNPVITCFNPRIVDTGDVEIVLDEGCLSYPGLSVKIRRAKNIKVRYTLPNGETVTQKFTGITARVFLHEFDHMEGLNFINRAGKLARETATRRWAKQKKLNNLKNKLGYR